MERWMVTGQKYDEMERDEQESGKDGCEGVKERWLKRERDRWIGRD